MKYNSTIGIKVQGQIRRFSSKLSKGLSKPGYKVIKCISQFKRKNKIN